MYPFNDHLMSGSVFHEVMRKEEAKLVAAGCGETGDCGDEEKQERYLEQMLETYRNIDFGHLVKEMPSSGEDNTVQEIVGGYGVPKIPW